MKLAAHELANDIVHEAELSQSTWLICVVEEK